MTSEQIAELRKLHDGVIAQDTEWARRNGQQIYPENVAFMVACNNWIDRLLDEREALLDACRAADDALGNASEGGRFYAAAIGRVQAAIAKAESP